MTNTLKSMFEQWPNFDNFRSSLWMEIHTDASAWHFWKLCCFINEKSSQLFQHGNERDFKCWNDLLLPSGWINVVVLDLNISQTNIKMLEVWRKRNRVKNPFVIDDTTFSVWAKSLLIWSDVGKSIGPRGIHNK